MSSARVIIVGAGVFGLTAALEIKRRGHEVLLLDQGAIPHPLAASTDISKVVRMEYGADATYMALAEAAIAGWRHWNEHWQRSGNSELYHETGVLMMSLDEMAPGGFEYESFRLLEARGHQPERLGGETLADRFPAWVPAFADGFFHRRGGFVESGRVIATLAEQARERGITVRENTVLDSVVEVAGGVGVFPIAEKALAHSQNSPLVPIDQPLHGLGVSGLRSPDHLPGGERTGAFPLGHTGIRLHT